MELPTQDSISHLPQQALKWPSVRHGRRPFRRVDEHATIRLPSTHRGGLGNSEIAGKLRETSRLSFRWPPGSLREKDVRQSSLLLRIQVGRTPVFRSCLIIPSTLH